MRPLPNLMSLLASFEWSFIWDNRDEFLHGLWKTLQVSLIAIAGAFAVGVVLGAGRAHRIPVLSQLAAIYVGRLVIDGRAVDGHGEIRAGDG